MILINFKAIHLEILSFSSLLPIFFPPFPCSCWRTSPPSRRARQRSRSCPAPTVSPLDDALFLHVPRAHSVVLLPRRRSATPTPIEGTVILREGARLPHAWSTKLTRWPCEKYPGRRRDEIRRERETNEPWSWLMETFRTSIERPSCTEAACLALSVALARIRAAHCCCEQNGDSRHFVKGPTLTDFRSISDVHHADLVGPAVVCPPSSWPSPTRSP